MWLKRRTIAISINRLLSENFKLFGLPPNTGNNNYCLDKNQQQTNRYIPSTTNYLWNTTINTPKNRCYSSQIKCFNRRCLTQCLHFHVINPFLKTKLIQNRKRVLQLCFAIGFSKLKIKYFYQFFEI